MKKFEKVLADVELVKDKSLKQEEEKNISAYTLVVKSPFGNYKRGDQIHDSDKVNEILGTHHAAVVLKVNRKAG